MRNSILKVFLLVLKIFFNFCLDTIYKYNKFCKILLKKSFKLILSKKNSFILFNLYFMLLLVNVDLIIKE